jgi:hypothetical protein
MGLAFLTLGGCSSDLGDGPVAVSGGARPGVVAAEPARSSGLVQGAGGVAATGADGYPNINVDTARRLGGRTRTAEDQDRLEAELMALGAQQRAGADARAPASVIGELQELGRRSKRDAETLIESGAAPNRP